MNAACFVHFVTVVKIIVSVRKQERFESLRPRKNVYNDNREKFRRVVCLVAFGCVLGVLELGGK